MNARMIHGLALSVLCTMLLGGCTEKPPAFLPQVARADQVVVSDWLIGAKLVLTGQEAAGLNRAVSLAVGPPSGLHLDTTCSAKFYRSTNLLARIDFEGGCFATSLPDFVRDESGSLALLE